jgi:serine O-acetyltransferase
MIKGFFYVKTNMNPTEKLFKSIHETYQTQGAISKKSAEHWIDCLIGSLFPSRAEVLCADHGLQYLKTSLDTLLKQAEVPNERQSVIREYFFEQIPFVYEALKQDMVSIFHYDPAATSMEEVLVAYPGFFAIAVHRFAHLLYQENVPILPRMWSEYAHSLTGIDIHPGAQIAVPFFIDHGTGIVIGETSVIGQNVRIYQGVTLGALSVKKELAQTKRHPTIEDNVVIYANATVLGGQTVIGHDSVIGGNVWLTESLAPHSIVQHKSEIVVRSTQMQNEPINWVI